MKLSRLLYFLVTSLACVSSVEAWAESKIPSNNVAKHALIKMGNERVQIEDPESVQVQISMHQFKSSIFINVSSESLSKDKKKQSKIIMQVNDIFHPSLREDLRKLFLDPSVEVIFPNGVLDEAQRYKVDDPTRYLVPTKNFASVLIHKNGKEITFKDYWEALGKRQALQEHAQYVLKTYKGVIKHMNATLDPNEKTALRAQADSLAKKINNETQQIHDHNAVIDGRADPIKAEAGK
jgi:hypothetical protein